MTLLNDRILNSISKPERYIGMEMNSVMKNKDEVGIRFAFAFPDVYEVGMSHLGLMLLYDMFNKRSDVWCERVFSPWPDLDAVMREQKIPLFALESQEPVRNFDFLGITLQYEMCYTNVLQILELSQIPLYAIDRTDDDPIVIGGGPCAYNPEPMAAFFDMFYIGEGEVSYDALFDLYLECKNKGFDRCEFLKKAALIEGIYVPSLYNVSYNEDGTLKEFTPIEAGIPERVKRVLVSDFETSPHPEKPVVPYLQVVQDRMTLEIQRGCIRGCRFCQAGMIYRPLRDRSKERLLEIANALIENTGYDEISLNSLSSSDYKELGGLLDGLIKMCNDKKVNISLPSLRIDSFAIDVMKKVQDVKKSSVTFAPEAGSQRMRDIINKGLSECDILTGARTAFNAGWSKVKLYFMLGLPFEEEDDISAIAELCENIAKEYYEIPKEERFGKVQLTASSSFFVPKPFTAFQWAAMNKEDEFLEKARFLKDRIREQLNQKSIRYKYHDADVSVLEGVMARGDRRLSDVVLAAYRNGALFDAWTDLFNGEAWDKAFDECGIDKYFYTARERDVNELLPWDFIDIGVSRRFLEKEWEKAKMGIVTPDCRTACAGCGMKC